MSLIHQLENMSKRVLAGNPAAKRALKGVYQRFSYAVSPKLKCEGALHRVTPLDGHDWFFGYYDKSPWDASGRYMLALRVKPIRSPAPAEAASLMLIDTQSECAPREIARTHAWNVQQGAMAQWLGPDFSERVFYNDFRNGRYCGVVLNVRTGAEERVTDRAVYTLSRDGRFGMSADFSRLHRLRPGYGYSNLPDETANDPCPDAPAVWRVDLESGKSEPVLKYTDLKGFEPRPEMENAVHKVNHLMLNPSGTRLMLLHRFFVGQKKYTRLVTLNPDGSGLYNLSDGDFVSHCNWKNDTEILGYLRHAGRDGYYLLRDQSADCAAKYPALDTDGHMSYSPNGAEVITDTYPNPRRLSSVYLLEGEKIRRVARVFSPFRYDGDLRCDLHPRWNPAGDQIAIDSTHEGARGLYVIQL